MTSSTSSGKNSSRTYVHKFFVPFDCYDSIIDSHVNGYTFDKNVPNFPFSDEKNVCLGHHSILIKGALIKSQ